MSRSVFVLISLLALIGMTACTSGAAPGQSDPALYQTPSGAEPSDSENVRETTIQYIRDLTSLSRDYEHSLEDAQVRVELSHSDGVRIRITGDIERLREVTEGFGRRLNQLIPPSSIEELGEIHRSAVRVVTSELEWLDGYESSVSAADPVRVREEEMAYVERLPTTDINHVDQAIKEIARVHNIPLSQMGFRHDDFRLTILDEDFVRQLVI